MAAGSGGRRRAGESARAAVGGQAPPGAAEPAVVVNLGGINRAEIPRILLPTVCAIGTLRQGAAPTPVVFEGR